MIQKPKGTRDLFFYEADLYNYIIDNFKKIAKLFDFKYIQTPTFESYNLFYRSVGETSDLVNKEMYLFKDKANRKMALRPENTAGVLRALIENKLIFAKENKFYYVGQMFRYERPQKGRFREFIQIGAEWINNESIFCDFEIINFANTFIKTLGLKNIVLKVNNIGNINERKNYLKILKTYFENYKDNFDDVSLERLKKNPLRILDDKAINHQDFIKKAPKLYDYLSQETKENFNNLLLILKDQKINFKIDYSLVRGLDYYTDLVFEFIYYEEEINSELTILSGGRYSNLIKELEGPDKKGIGFAAGVDRLMILLEKNNFKINKKPIIYLFNENQKDIIKNISFVKKLREKNIIIRQNFTNFKLNKIYNETAKDKIDFLIYKDVKLNKNILKNINKNTSITLEEDLTENELISKIKNFIKG